MNDRFDLPDLDPAERDVHRVLAAVPLQPVPFGFRDLVMARLRNDRHVAWEWIVAAVIAIPNLVFLARQVGVHGQDFVQAMANVMTAASADTADAFFFVDGLTVVALAFVGIASALAAHALFVTASPPRGPLAR